MISVIIPLYNAERFIARALDSVLAQTYKDFEVIVVNDGSTDESVKICNSYTDERIKLFSQENKGPGTTRNYGLRVSKGDLIFFLDADDYIEKDALQTLYDGYRKSGKQMVVGSAVRRTANGKVCKDNSPITTSYRGYFSPCDQTYFSPCKDRIIFNQAAIVHYVRKYIETNDIYLVSNCWGRLYDRKLIGNMRFNEKMKLGEDGDFNLRCLAKTNGVMIINEPLYCFQLHDKQSLSLIPINCDSKLHDFRILRRGLIRFLGYTPKNLDSHIANLIIAQLIRASESYDYEEIKKFIESEFVQNALKNYRPKPGHSKTIPFLMKYKMIWLTMGCCRKRRVEWIKNYS